MFIQLIARRQVKDCLQIAPFVCGNAHVDSKYVCSPVHTKNRVPSLAIILSENLEFSDNTALVRKVIR
jgi:hypothetical protein